ncbi:MAG: DNA polymerase Y family protein [Dehalococcoidia bacterium]
MRVGCVLITHFLVSLERLDRPDLRDRPVIIGGAPEERQVVWDCSPEAEYQGVRPGMQLRSALSHCRDATFIEPRPGYYEDRFEEILRRLEKVGPFVDPGKHQGEGPSGFAFVNLAGVRSPTLPQQLLDAVPAGLPATAGIAAGKFAARVAALYSEGEPRVVEDGELREFLRDLPSDLLPVSDSIRWRFHLFGLRTMGELAELPRSGVQAQFGPEGLQAWKLANGGDDEPVRGRRRDQLVTRRLTFPTPTASVDSLLIAVRQMLGSAFALPALRNKGIRRIRMRAVLGGGRSWERTLTLKEPSSDKAHIFFALKTLVGNLVLPGPVEEVALQLSDFCGETGKQGGMFTGNAGRELQLQESVRQLKARFGRTPIYRMVEVEPWSRIPERRQALIDYDP